MEDTNLIIKAKDSIVKALDQNGNGEIDIEDIITLAFKTPGVHVTRAIFFCKKNYIRIILNQSSIKQLPLHQHKLLYLYDLQNARCVYT